MTCPTFLLLSLLSVELAAQEPATLTFAKVIPLPGVKGRFDHFAIDVKGQRLFVAALGNNTLEIVDLAGGKQLHSIEGLHKPQGVIFLAEPNRIYVASGDDGTLKIFDGASYRLLNTIAAMPDADNLRYDVNAKLIYVGYGDGALAVIDAASEHQIANIKLQGHPESFQFLGRDGARISVNVPDAQRVAVVDCKSRNVTTMWQLSGFRANFPMALDEANHRIFIGCRQPARLAVLDDAMGKVVSNLAIAGDTDDLFYDSNLKCIYISCGEGFIEVIEQQDANIYRSRERIRTVPGARTSFFCPELKEFYLAEPISRYSPASIRVYRTRK